jgi:hypothetical protein
MPKKYNPLLPTGLDYYETNAPGGGITNIRISAGTAAQNLSAFTLSNSNNVSFGISASTITASASYPAQTSYVFSNSNGVTFGTNGSTVTASVATNYQSQGAYLTTAALSQDSSKYAGINGAITGGSLTVNTSGVSINLPAYLTTAQPVGDYLTTAMASNRGSDFVQATAAFAGTNASGTIASNGISISVNPGGGAGDGYNIVGVNGNSVGSAATVQFSNSNNVTFGLAGSTVTASASYPAQTAFVFSNSNGVSFGTNGSTVTATVATNYQSQGAYLTTARASNDAIGLNTALTANGVAWTVNSSGLSLNVPAFLTTVKRCNAFKYSSFWWNYQ